MRVGTGRYIMKRLKKNLSMRIVWIGLVIFTFIQYGHWQTLMFLALAFL